MAQRKRKQWRFLVGGLLVVALGASLSGCAFVNVSLFRPAQPLQEKVVEGEGPGKVLLLDVSGVLAHEERGKAVSLKEHVGVLARVKEELRLAAGDPEVKALILRIYSPGGTVSACDLLHHELQEFRENTQVKVAACLMGLATSGGYYVATAADHIIAQPTTLTGSIGAIAFKVNVQGLMEKVGIEEESVKSGDKKDIWSPLRPATEEERDILQEIINEYQGKFLEVVREARPHLTQDDLAAIGDGRVLTGRQALELHLVDEIGYLSDAVEWARKAAEMPRARVVLYHRPGTYVENIYSIPDAKAWNWPSRIQQERLLSPQFMYLWLP